MMIDTGGSKKFIYTIASVRLCNNCDKVCSKMKKQTGFERIVFVFDRIVAVSAPIISQNTIADKSIFWTKQSKKLPARAVEYYGMKSAFTTYMGARTVRSAPMLMISRGSLSAASALAISKINLACAA